MEFLDEYRDRKTVKRLSEAIHRATTRPWTVMEVCGGQTHAIVRFGLDSLLPDQIDLLHGPGCPVCVTPVEILDQAIAIARLPGVIFCTFGDMLRVPGSREDLFAAKSDGADVRMVYSPLDALRLAKKNPDREVVFFAVGFETTAPANAMAAYQAREQGLTNLSLLVSHVLVPPALESLLDNPECRIDGFLAAGHVCTVVGFDEYFPISARYRVPIVVTGFEPVDILQGVLMCVRQLEDGCARVENQYSRSVVREGNRHAQDVMRQVFHVVPRKWRGLGEIPASGLDLRPEFELFDAAGRFEVEKSAAPPQSDCISGLILQGLQKPHNCPHFGTRCTPEHPLGATMVSSEGACAAYYRYRPRSETTAV